MQTLEINKKLFYTKINLNNQKTNRNDNSRQVEFLDVTDEEEEIDPLERSIIDLKNLNKSHKNRMLRSIRFNTNHSFLGPKFIKLFLP